MEKKPRRKYEVPVVETSQPITIEVPRIEKSKLRELYEQRPIITGGETPRDNQQKLKELEKFYHKIWELAQ